MILYQILIAPAGSGFWTSVHITLIVVIIIRFILVGRTRHVFPVGPVTFARPAVPIDAFDEKDGSPNQADLPDSYTDNADNPEDEHKEIEGDERLHAFGKAVTFFEGGVAMKRVSGSMTGSHLQ